MSQNTTPAELARVRRKPSRARYDTAAVYAVLDAAPLCHVATVRRDRPIVLPMAFGRIGDVLVLHGSPVAGLFRDAAADSPVCVTATLLDALVLARSARNHSMNYRSVVVHGEAVRVTEPDRVMAGLRAVVEHVTPGRWAQIREPTGTELRETALWQVAIGAAAAGPGQSSTASVKIRSGSTLDPDADRAWPVWAGQIPARLTFGPPVEADDLPPGTPFPGYLRAL
jgi:nitroimidazol reductase NimA-like FMN-containing flavoprotein (pyridoxamine 5'-phosphate oxidase superfamily)